MEEFRGVRYLIDRAIARLDAQAGDSPLKRLEPLKLRRLLAEAAFREFRKLQREIDAEKPHS
jgi:glutamine synthetase adenylyltransferase